MCGVCESVVCVQRFIQDLKVAQRILRAHQNFAFARSFLIEIENKQLLTNKNTSMNSFTAIVLLDYLIIGSCYFYQKYYNSVSFHPKSPGLLHKVDNNI